MKKISTLIVALFAIASVVNGQGFDSSPKSSGKFVLKPADKNYTLFESTQDGETIYILSLRDRQYDHIIEFFDIAIGTKQDVIDFVKSCQNAFNTLGKDEIITIEYSELISVISTTRLLGVKSLMIFGVHPAGKPFGYFYPQNMKKILSYFGE